MQEQATKKEKPDTRLVKGADGKIHTVYVRTHGRIKYLLGVVESFPAFNTDARRTANLLQ